MSSHADLSYSRDYVRALKAENQQLRDALERLRDTPPSAMHDYEAFVLDVAQKALAAVRVEGKS